jgi:hypothetical protein
MILQVFAGEIYRLSAGDRIATIRGPMRGMWRRDDDETRPRFRLIVAAKSMHYRPP